MSAVVGIDLGTTNTVVAHVSEGRAAALSDDKGNRLLPSVVSFHPQGHVLVGGDAKERRLQDARNTIYSVKRLIGRAWESDDVNRARSRFPFELREGPGQAVLVVARNETYTLPEISAFVLRKAKALAEKALGEKVERAVITVPASFNDLQRAATKVAGRVAGIEVLRILNEPTAAALAYGYGKSNAERIAIYDLGGGTFDITLLDLSGNVFEVLATAGDTFLGGDDVDLALADRIADSFLKAHRYDPRSDPQVFERVRSAAESLKHQLSQKPEANVMLKDIAFGAGGKALSHQFKMSRGEFDTLTKRFVDQTFDVCNDAMKTARMKPGDFDQVVLVGGSTRMPLVRSAVKDFFGKEPLTQISPDEVVAIGAAIQAMALTSGERRSGSSSRRRPRTHGVLRKTPTLGGLGKSAARASGGKKSISSTDPGIAPPAGAEDGLPLVTPGRSTAKGLAPAAALAAGRVRQQTGGGMKLPPASKSGTGPTTQSYERRPPRPKRAKPGGTTLPSVGSSKPAASTDITEESFMGALPLVGGSDGSGSPAPPPVAAFDDSEEATRAFTRDEMDLPDDITKNYDVADLDPEGLATTLTEAEPEAPKPPPPPPPPPELEQGGPPPKPRKAPPKPKEAYDPPPPLVYPDSAKPKGRPQGPGGTQVLPTVPTEAKAPPPKAPPKKPAGMGQTLALGAMPDMGIPEPQIGQQVPPAKAPLLIDVTPLSLCVETINDYCDVIIKRNTPVPCDRTRVFVTAQNNQAVVRLRVAQGEDLRFSQNTHLGELELSGLREAARGTVQISVTFEVDADGILQVKALDVDTGREAKATLKLVAQTGGQDVSSLQARQEQHQII